ncbi:hypothetical protein FV219_03850 [Methylobacterium sp. WL122]|nr:hypothetical protein FV219_03850 [Methylobacterium sp. WL122]
MKDIQDLFVWIWVLIQSAAHYIYVFVMACIGFIYALYNISYQLMTDNPSFQSVPHLGKVLLSSLVAGLIPLILLALIRAILPAFVRGHMQDALGYTGQSSSFKTKDINPTPNLKPSLKPFIRFDDPTVQVSKLSKSSGGSWNAKIVQGQKQMTMPLSGGSAGGVTYISAFGSQGTIEWGD